MSRQNVWEQLNATIRSNSVHDYGSDIHGTFHYVSDVHGTFHDVSVVHGTFHDVSDAHDPFHDGSDVHGTFHDVSDVHGTFYGGSDVHGTFHDGADVHGSFHDGSNAHGLSQDQHFFLLSPFTLDHFSPPSRWQVHNAHEPDSHALHTPPHHTSQLLPVTIRTNNSNVVA
jgi:hypothetical protein